MADVRGALTVSAGGRDYRLWLGMSVLADLQAQFGQDVLSQLDPPDGVAADDWMPPLSIMIALIVGALERYHAAEADRWLADEILIENADVLPALMAAAFPDAGDQVQPGKTRPKGATRR